MPACGSDSITYRWNYHLLAHPGFVVLMTDYRGSTGYGEKFTLDILNDPLKGPADDINDAADEAIKRFPFIDATRQAAGGASYGGHLTNWLAGTTTRYKALVSHAGLASLDMQWATSDGIYHRELMMGGPYWENPAKWTEQSPLAKAGAFKTPTLDLDRRERLPRAGGEFAGDVFGAAAHERPGPAAGVAGREPLDSEGGEQPGLLPRGASLAREIPAPGRDVRPIIRHFRTS